MQEALPYKRWEALPPNPVAVASVSPCNIGNTTITMSIASLVKENPVMVLGKRGCCMCHVVRKLLLGLGVNPPVFEIDAQTNEIDLLLNSLSNDKNNVSNLQFPVVFVGGEVFGGLDRVMATHLSGELVPILKNVGALWL
ncbi:glutaredoxin-C9 [Amaranthus tricolor]|uniref:glutaredoxin-C9 n=1 Tax=Amaranthus tricolor TaxID=29722 RepID=UPI0025872F96|nr:glutaredoxin-C9 [Amaranthus tricolor]